MSISNLKTKALLHRRLLNHRKQVVYNKGKPWFALIFCLYNRYQNRFLCIKIAFNLKKINTFGRLNYIILNTIKNRFISYTL